MRSRAWLVAAWIVLLAACSTDPRRAVGTSLRIEVEFPEELGVEQLRFSASAEDVPLFEPAVRPEVANGPLPSGQTLRVLLPDERAGQTVVVRIEGLVSGQVVVAGEAQAQVVEGYEVDLGVGLETGGLDAGLPDAGSSGCAGCTGCCLAGACVPLSLEACGIPGAPCVACNPTKADRCVEGSCRCGLGPACGDGLACVDGECKCTPSSCPDGCCQEDACLTPSAFFCGVGGVACQTCDPLISDACVEGLCRCHGGAACGPGQECGATGCICTARSCPTGCCTASGACLPGDAPNACGSAGGTCEACPGGSGCERGVCDSCNPESCPSGCCSGPTCHAPSVAACGQGAGGCVSCGTGSDRCIEGQCRCGEGAACGAGQRCQSGQCVCDSSSCPSGCCDGSVCRLRALDSCGTGGHACLACDPKRANACLADGPCSCGGGSACLPGQACVDRQCVCNAASCPDGCCDGNVCRPRSLESCGVGGESCERCPVGADECSPAGECRCGAHAQCGEGQACVDGACVCNAASCPDGCCESGVCRPASTATCGTAGAACVACDAERASGCSDGHCGCGAGPACGPGQTCNGQQCVCNAATCPSGCCLDGACQEPSLVTCGSSGGSCVACDAEKADGCRQGKCSCGTRGSPCGDGQRCVAGACVCDGFSWPDGCCDGNTPQPGTSKTACGTGGQSCDACSPPPHCNSQVCSSSTSCGGGRCASGSSCHPPSLQLCFPASGSGNCREAKPCDRTRADTCSPDGTCLCGDGPACGAGFGCHGGECVCDATTCPHGCCGPEGCVKGTSSAACGKGGAACQACEAPAACVSRSCRE